MTYKDRPKAPNVQHQNRNVERDRYEGRWSRCLVGLVFSLEVVVVFFVVCSPAVGSLLVCCSVFVFPSHPSFSLVCSLVSFVSDVSVVSFFSSPPFPSPSSPSSPVSFSSPLSPSPPSSPSSRTVHHHNATAPVGRTKNTKECWFVNPNPQTKAPTIHSCWAW